MRAAAARNSTMAAARSPGHLEQVGPHRVEAVVVAEPLAEAVEQRQAGVGPLRHGDGDRAVERDHRVAGHPFEQAVQGQDLGPVGVVVAGGLVVDGGDRRLHLVLAHLAPPQRAR